MNIVKLHNLRTKDYLDLKDLILSPHFPWYVSNAHNTDDFKFFSHIFVKRPGEGTLFPVSQSSHANLVNTVLGQILYLNDIDISCLYRSNANLVPPSLEVKRTTEHVDHEFPHNNLLIYLTDSGGKTIVGNESYDPKEDDVIMFGGHSHCIETSHKKNRVVIVATFGTKKGEIV
tara:strand:- start:56 stop:577 length:522 start_codon:yes stop_codon:yes gene_type:complete